MLIDFIIGYRCYDRSNFLSQKIPEKQILRNRKIENKQKSCYYFVFLDSRQIYTTIIHINKI